MKVKTFQARAIKHLTALHALVNQHMKDDGNTEADSQRICVLNRLNTVGYAFNGTQQSDMKRP